MESIGSQDEMDARIERLWKQLDPQNKGEIDLQGLRSGLKKIQHRQPPDVLAMIAPTDK